MTRPWWVAALLMACSTTLARGASAQAAADTAARAPAKPDTAAAGYGDSTRTGIDTAARVPAPPVAVDTVLSSACGSVPAGAVAPGLLIVVFRSEATTKERADALSQVGGASAGSAPNGGEYVRLADTVPARGAADQLILNPAVATVAEKGCPANPAPAP